MCHLGGSGGGAARAMVPLDVGRMRITITNVVTIIGILPWARGP